MPPIHFARRAAAIAILAACAVDANAFCFTWPAHDSSDATALPGGGYAYEGGAQASRSTCAAVDNQNLTDFYAPYFSDMSISNISQSAGWTHDVEATNDLFHVGGGVLHFSLSTALAYRPLAFSFDAGFAPLAAASTLVAIGMDGTVVSTSIPLGTVQDIGNVFSMPGSPDAIAGFAPAVPEPSSAAMLAAGLALVCYTASRRTRGAPGQARSC